jgi:uncharacterized metal-binding protein
MPAGKTHLVFNGIGGAGATVLTLIGTESLPLSFGVAIGCAIGSVISPDLDVDAGNISHKMFRKLGSIPYHLWNYFWLPYALAVSHRSNLSHAPLLGTLVRVLYMFFPVSVNIFANDRKYGWKIFFGSLLSQILSIWLIIFVIFLLYAGILVLITSFAAAILFGWIFVDIIHWAADLISTKIK